MTKFFKPGSSEAVSPAVEGETPVRERYGGRDSEGSCLAYPEATGYKFSMGTCSDRQPWFSTSPVLPPCNTVLHVTVKPPLPVIKLFLLLL